MNVQAVLLGRTLEGEHFCLKASVLMLPPRLEARR
jgi:hypothetical protein